MRRIYLLAILFTSLIFSQIIFGQTAENLPAPGTTTAAKLALDPKLAAMDASITALQAPLANANAIKSVNDLMRIKENMEIFKTSKNACVRAAETAQTMCFESTSPEGNKVKTMINAAGPTLAALSGAVKACSSTALLMDAAKTGLMLAKGACIGAKLLCDDSCSTATKQVQALLKQITEFTASAKLNLSGITSECKTEAVAGAPPPYCGFIPAAEQQVQTFSASSPANLGFETSPTPLGTTTSIVVKCQNHTADILLMATNIASVVMAHNSAVECEKKLSTTGGPGVSTKEYCEVPANSSTAYCKCFKDNTIEGCPGYLALKPKTESPNDDPGKNLKAGGDGNGFAGFDKVKPSAIDLGSLKPDPDSKAGDSASGGSKVKIGDSNSAAAGAGSASGTLGGGALDAKGGQAGDDKKKWSFGSFLGLGGGSGSGSGSGRNSDNGSIGEKNMDALKRQIASEKLRNEVSGASGKSNWEKVSERYLRNSSTLLVGQ